MNKLKFAYLFFIKKVILTFLIWFILLLSYLPGSSQKTYRRHLIFALDYSDNYWNIENDNTAIDKSALGALQERLFKGDRWDWSGNISNLWNAEENRYDLFDAERDEISFIYFNYSLPINSNDTSTVKLQEFERNYFKKVFLGSKVKDDGHNIAVYFSNSFRNISQSRVRQSKFVYPLILNIIENRDFAEEYILIVISRNYIETINENDVLSLNTIIGNQGNTLSYQINKLHSLYDKEEMPYFEGYQDRETNTQRVISGYRITPKNVAPGSVATAVTLNQYITFKQTSYKGDIYEITNLNLKFPDNSLLKPTAIALKITEQDNSTPLLTDEISQITNERKWKSNETGGNCILKLKNGAYSISGLKTPLLDLNSKKKPLKLELTIKTKVTDGIINPLNFVFYSSADASIESYPLIKYLLYRIGPFLLLIMIILVIIYLGKPIALKFTIDGYLDSYEIIDYKTVGRLLTPYKAWNSEIHTVDYLLVKGELRYKYFNYPFNWNTSVNIKLQNVKVPNGFELFLKYDNNDINEFGHENTMSINRIRRNNFSFIVGIRQNNKTRPIIDPQLVKFSIEGVAKDSKLYVKAELREILEYKFYIGGDLGDVWVGFDPGTTGSCVAVGSSTENIILAEDRPNNRIITSVIAFEKEANFIPNGSQIPKSIYAYGERARIQGQGRANKWRSFHSFKKLLGYKTAFDISFTNGNVLNVNGKKLAGLLVEGLYDDLYKFANRVGFDNREYLSKGKFEPLRAVVAIPNNFTITKTQDMVDCINNFDRFKEIRYVYEAEAVLFFYLSNFRKFNLGEDKLDLETVLVFDMGGATINATVVTVNKTLINKRPKYEIDLLGKIGYGIGGDTIDYCIAKFILSFTEEFPQLAAIDLFEKQVVLADLAFQIKKEIIANYNKSLSYLITAFNLENFINRSLGVSISIDEETSEMYKYFVKVSGKYKIFEHPLFSKTIYNNVKDAVNEVIELSENIQIGKIIFSGRSTLFPMVKETVESNLLTNNSAITSIALNLEESKTAVAKGACWYGINKNSVRLNNLKTNASFGFKKTQSADKTDVKFHELVEMGCNFDISHNGIDSFHGVKEYEDDFAFDGSKVNFYQVMGKNANKILSEEQKHKYSKIATINLDQITSKIAMKVSENDEVECAVLLQANPNRPLKERGVVADQEIDEANEEHYTWFVK